MACTFLTFINQDFLEKAEPYDKWKSIVFMHSIAHHFRLNGQITYKQQNFNFKNGG